ncbi:MAG: RNA methyltransferase [Nodosilinea sp. LVE1205-7]|jgi:TrmH family RNA methyltransferase
MLTSLQNPLVKDVRRLHQAKYRRQQGQLLLEGTHGIQEALAVAWPLQVVCYTPAWQQRYPDLAIALQDRAQRVQLVSPEVLQTLATTVHPDGVIAVAAQQSPLPAPAVTGVGLVLDGLQDPGNLGTIIRTAVAAGCDGLWLSHDSVAADHPKVLRASAGQWFRLSLVVAANLDTTIQDWRQQGIQLVATDPRAEIGYWEADLTGPTVFLLGNEGAGLAPAYLSQASLRVAIPMEGGVESLNVAIAAALLLYEAKRQRCSAAKS